MKHCKSAMCSGYDGIKSSMDFPYQKNSHNCRIVQQECEKRVKEVNTLREYRFYRCDTLKHERELKTSGASSAVSSTLHITYKSCCM